MTHDIIVVGASAGGVEALMAFVAALPPDLPAAVFVVLHLPPNAQSSLATILARKGSLPAKTAVNGDTIQPGMILVAPPNRHLLLSSHGVIVIGSPKENNNRPAIDPLFRTAAITFGTRVVGVILSGMLNDGTAGLQVIKRCGGMALVQDPATALYGGMPESACKYVAVDSCAPVQDLANMVTQLARQESDHQQKPRDIPEEMRVEASVEQHGDMLIGENHLGTLLPMTCPTCHGPLWEMEEGGLVRYRCRVGHGFTGEIMAQRQDEDVENSLWALFNLLEESALLYQHMSNAARSLQDAHLLIEDYQGKIDLLHQRAQQIREMLALDVYP